MTYQYTVQKCARQRAISAIYPTFSPLVIRCRDGELKAVGVSSTMKVTYHCGFALLTTADDFTFFRDVMLGNDFDESIIHFSSIKDAL